MNPLRQPFLPSQGVKGTGTERLHASVMSCGDGLGRRRIGHRLDGELLALREDGE